MVIEIKIVIVGTILRLNYVYCTFVPRWRQIWTFKVKMPSLKNVTQHVSSRIFVTIVTKSSHGGPPKRNRRGCPHIVIVIARGGWEKIFCEAKKLLTLSSWGYGGPVNTPLGSSGETPGEICTFLINYSLKLPLNAS